MAFESMEEWLRSSADKNISTAEAVIQEDMSDRGVSREETWTQMSRMWEAMRSSEPVSYTHLGQSYHRCERSGSAQNRRQYSAHTDTGRSPERSFQSSDPNARHPEER